MPTRVPFGRTAAVSVALAALVFASPGCSDDDSGSGSSSDAPSCEELLGSFDVNELSSDEAQVVADRVLDLATEQAADDGSIDEKVACSSIIRILDGQYPEVVAGLDLERLEQDARASLEE